MSEESKIESVAAQAPSEFVPAREAGVATEPKDTEMNGTGVAASEVQKDPATTEVKKTNGITETNLQDTATSKAKETGVEAIMADEKPAETAVADSSAAPGVATPASAKSKSRRKSSGVPEHKSKKSGKKGVKAANSHSDAKPGDYFYIRLKGYPLWPGIVCSEDMLPSSLIKSRPVTAARADGTYRDDYQDGGKKINDRTFPVMYLFTQEFGWIPNFDLVDIDLDNLGEPDEKMRKDLAQAHRIAAEKHDLQYWKDVLIEFQAAIDAEKELKEAKAAEKAAAKSAVKGKRKSKSAIDADDENEDVDMADAPLDDADESTEKKPKSSKKRKAIADVEESADTPARSDSVKKLKLKVNSSTPKTPNGNATPKSATKKDQSAAKSSKSKNKKATNGAAAEAAVSPQEPELTAEEKLAKKDKEIMFLRHKLQKGLLTRDAQPKEEEMKQMSDYITKLEEHVNLEVSIMKSTKINKVLKAILKLDSIPKEGEFHFKDRSQALLNEWNKILGADQTTAATPTAADKPAKELSNGVSVAKTDEKSADPAANAEEKIAETVVGNTKNAAQATEEETAEEVVKPSASDAAVKATA